jgi:COMPASS component SPP1
MANRAGVLALMLHSTYNHELVEKMSKQPSASQTSDPEQHKKK